MATSSTRLFPLLGIFLALVTCAIVYYPGLHGEFTFDDAPNIVDNVRLQVDTFSVQGLRQASLSSDSGPLKRPIAMLSFWLNYYTTGLSPVAFKLTNLLIHLLNGLGLFFLAKLLLASPMQRSLTRLVDARHTSVALAAATLWLLHPLNVTAVLYVVQRMTSLSATFVIAGLLAYLWGRQRLARGAHGMLLLISGLIGCSALAALTKENGLLLPFFAAVIELTLFRFAGLAASARKKLAGLFWVTVVTPFLLAGIWLVTHLDWLMASYQTRPFTLFERILTEGRILWYYVLWIFVPTPGALGFYHDDIALSHGVLSPVTTLLAIMGLLAVIAAAIRYRNRAPLFTFATLWFLIGQSMESSIFPLELVFEHRNYLPMFGPILAGTYLLMLTAEKLSSRVRLIAPILFATCMALSTASRAIDWGSMNRMTTAFVRHHPNSARANYERGVEIARLTGRDPAQAGKHYDQIRSYFIRASELDHAAVNGLFGIILLDATHKRPMDRANLDKLAARLAEAPFTFKVVGAFRSLVNWLQNGTVSMEQNTVVDLFTATLSNPTIDSNTRATLFSILSSYWFNVAHDAQNAVSMAIAATHESPNQPTFRLSLADLAITLGNLELAKTELEKAENLDTLGQFRLKVESLRKALATAEMRHP